MPFIPKLTSKLGEVLKSVNMNPVFYPYIKIGRLFPDGQDSTPPLAKSDVYLLSCRDCPAVYVGKTGRCFAARFCDHLSASLEMREENPRFKIYSGIPYLVSFSLKRFHRTACSDLFGKNEFNLHHVEIEITKNEEPMF